MIELESRVDNEIEYLPPEIAVSMMMDEVDRCLSASPPIVREYTKHLAASRGKSIRGISLITCAQNRDNLVHPNAVKFAAAIEILHLATLVHDDVIDDADIRRGMPTLQKKYGKKTAVICGDYLLSLALKIATDIPNREDYLSLNMPDYIARLCFGELRQHIYSGNLNLSAYMYLKIIAGKTAALFEASFFAGAVLSDASERDLTRYKRLGKYLGMIFQLMDDCLDFEATQQEAKKPVQSDFENDVITMPVIHALKNAEGLKEKAESRRITKSDIISAVLKSGSLMYTKNIARRYYNKFMAILDEIDITEEKKSAITVILNKAFRKN